MNAAIDPLEISALVRIMDELDYYQLLNVDPKASTTDIRKAYHASSRSFHPDANRTLNEDLRDHCGKISKRITEAYCVLRDSRRRSAYASKRAEAAPPPIKPASQQSHRPTSQTTNQRAWHDTVAIRVHVVGAVAVPVVTFSIAVVRGISR